MKNFGSLVVVSLLSCAVTLGAYNYFLAPNNAGKITLAAPNYAKKVSLGAENIDFTTAAENTIHAVVHVKNKTVSKIPVMDFFYGYRGDREQTQIGTGSGVIITEDGYIVTNNHVIKDATELEVTLNNNKSYIAKLVGTDSKMDIALLKIEADEKLPYTVFGDSEAIKVGEWVLAVGNPYNLNSTVTAGIVSAKARNIANDGIQSFIQTDAAVNPGNSGGALVNANGELIGINSAIASNTGSYSGYSFAVPVNIVRKVVADLLEFGEVQRAFIGVVLEDLNADLGKRKDISELNGVYVSGLNVGGAAEESGVKEGDVILKVQDVVVNNVPELQEQVGRFRPGDKVQLTINRAGIMKELSVILKNKNGDTRLIKYSESVREELGAEFSPVNTNEKNALNIQHGLRVNNIKEGRLRNIGIKDGFIITNVGDKVVNSLEDLTEALKSDRKGLLIEGIYPNGARAYYGIGI